MRTRQCACIYPLPATHLSGQTRDVLATLGPYSRRHAIGLQCFNYVPTNCLLLIVEIADLCGNVVDHHHLTPVFDGVDDRPSFNCRLAIAD